jgi:hypothetical protein
MHQMVIDGLELLGVQPTDLDSALDWHGTRKASKEVSAAELWQGIMARELCQRTMEPGGMERNRDDHTISNRFPPSDIAVRPFAKAYPVLLPIVRLP